MNRSNVNESYINNETIPSESTNDSFSKIFSAVTYQYNADTYRTFNLIGCGCLRRNIHSEGMRRGAIVKYGENYYNPQRNDKSLLLRRPRLVAKTGEININSENVHQYKRRLISDFFNTFLDVKWRWHIAFALFTFIVSWFIFATIWWLIALQHNDLVDLSPNSERIVTHISSIDEYYRIKVSNESTNYIGGKEVVNIIPCVFGVSDYTTAVLFSIETQHTIGYGMRHITRQCPFAIFMLMVQSLFGIFSQVNNKNFNFNKKTIPNCGLCHFLF
jgi:hypothetical protein